MSTIFSIYQQAPDLVKFLRSSKVLHLAVKTETDQLWSAPLFYAFDEAMFRFVCVSSENSRHFNVLSDSSLVSLSIAKESWNPVSLKGVQMTGYVHFLSRQDPLYALFVRRFPFARFYLKPQHRFFFIEPVFLSFTNNKRGFGNCQEFDFCS